jgi:O-succinylbenzoate synthase
VHDQQARAGVPGPVRAVELVTVRLPLVAPFRTARGSTTHKEALLVRVVTDAAEGWAECGAEPEPAYAGETIGTVKLVLRDHLVPRVLAGVPLDDVRGNPFARAAIETALLDAQLRATGVSLASYLGGTREWVDAGVAIGITETTDALVHAVTGYLDAGYRRVKLKIEPGSDVVPVAAVRATSGDDITLAVDANGSYRADDTDALARLDPFALQCIEQPLASDDLGAHARLAARVATRICLDESITSAAVARDAIAAGACRVVNLKPGRVGGIAEAVRVHDACVESDVPVIVGGMLDTGLGRAVNVALAAMPGVTEAGDVSASARYFAEDLTEPFLLEGGRLRVPDEPGVGRAPRPEVLRAVTTSREMITRRNGG